MDVVGIGPQELGVLVQLDQSVAVGRIAVGVIDGQQIAVGIQVAAEPMNVVVGQGILDVGRWGQAWRKGSSQRWTTVPRMSRSVAGAAVGHRVQRETVVGFVRVWSTVIFPSGTTGRPPPGEEVEDVRVHARPWPGEGLVQKFGRGQLKIHDGRAEEVDEAGEAEDG